MDTGNTSNCTGPESGSRSVESLYFSTALLLLSMLILVVISFTHRRKRLAQSCLGGYFALPVPMDFVTAPKYRMIYIVSFGVMASTLVLFYLNLSSPSVDNVYFKIFYKILIEPVVSILVTSLTFLPLFLCADTPLPLLGHSLGLLYSALALANVLRQDAEEFMYALCISSEGNTDTRIAHSNLAFTILKRIPVYCCFAFICGWYTFKTLAGAAKLCLTAATAHRQYTVFDRGSTGIKPHHAAHVKALLRRSSVGVPAKQSWFKRGLNYLFPYQGSSQYFRFPVPFLGAITAMAMLLYQLTFPIVTSMLALVIELAPLYAKLKPLLNLTGPVDDFASTVIVGLPVIAIIAPFLSLLLCIALLVHMTACVHRQLVAVARRGFTDEKLSSPAAQLAFSWKFLGSLLGYFTYAWVMYAILTAVLGIAVTVLWFGFKYFRTYAINTLLVIIVPFVVIRLVYFAQTLACKYIFLGESTEAGKFIPITNRRLFDWFHFLLFFYNGFAGFIGAIFRAALATAFGLLLLFRLDRLVMMRDFVWFDFGHKAYIGFLYVYSHYNNHVLHTFLHLLQDSIGSSKPRAGGCKRAHARWLVAYTLLRNPQLQPLRASQLAVGDESSGSSQGASVEYCSLGSELRNVAHHKTHSTATA